MSENIPPRGSFTQSEIIDFVAKRSDFAHEMAALRELQGSGYASVHAATYKDPITGKIREFDIRARRTFSPCSIRLAVECKNLSAESPLIGYSTPRGPHENFHSLVVRNRGPGQQFPATYKVEQSSIYPVNARVVRKFEQPTRGCTGQITSNDASTFEKWTQALSGVHDEVRKLLDEPLPDSTLFSVIPVLVVPDQTLWNVEFDIHGNQSSAVEPVDHCQLFIGHPWPFDVFGLRLSYLVSHLEVLTLPALGPWSRRMESEDGLFKRGAHLLTLSR